MWVLCVSLLPSYCYHTHSTSDTKHVGVIPIPSNSARPAGCPAILTLSTLLRTQSHDTSPGFRCRSQVAGPQVTHNFCPTWLQIRGSHDLLLGFDYLPEQLTELRETFTCFTSLLKDVIKDTDEQRYVGWGLGGSWAQELLSPWSCGCVTFLVHGCVHQPGSSLEPILLIFYGGFLM